MTNGRFQHKKLQNCKSSALRAEGIKARIPDIRMKVQLFLAIFSLALSLDLVWTAPADSCKFINLFVFVFRFGITKKHDG